jgi:hypothetical protein
LMWADGCMLGLEDACAGFVMVWIDDCAW